MRTPVIRRRWGHPCTVMTITARADGPMADEALVAADLTMPAPKAA
jgi:hypothetical protein